MNYKDYVEIVRKEIGECVEHVVEQDCGSDTRFNGNFGGFAEKGDVYDVYRFTLIVDERAVQVYARMPAFMQVDSICGHLIPDADKFYDLEIREARELGELFVLGGVRFKYQPVKSMRTLAEDLEIGTLRCDAIVVTGTGTGVATDIAKIREFRHYLGDFPLVVGAGMTAEIVLRGTLAKFSQNPALWEGENLLGFILMEARDILRDGDVVRLDAVFSANFDGKKENSWR